MEKSIMNESSICTIDDLLKEMNLEEFRDLIMNKMKIITIITRVM